MERMVDAVRAVLDAAGTSIPDDVGQRLLGADKLSDADRATIVAMAREALAPFIPKPGVPAPATEAKPATTPQAATPTTPTKQQEPPKATS
jgi:F-type H+-transporting ATPase subunit alpha